MVLMVCLLANFGCAAQQRNLQSKQWFKEFIDEVFMRSSRLPVAGVYYAFTVETPIKNGHALYLFSNGSFVEMRGIKSEKVTDTTLFIDSCITIDRQSGRLAQFWGIYKIHQDTLIGLRVAQNPSNPISYNRIEYKWLIRGSTLFKLSNSYSVKETIFSGRSKSIDVFTDKHGNSFFKSASQNLIRRKHGFSMSLGSKMQWLEK
jgi:hypothetical protein